VDEGDLLNLLDVRSDFRLADSARCVLVAGGIGITPLLAMLRVLHRRGADWTLHYGGRSLASMPFVDEPEQFGGRVVLHPEDEVGLLPLDGIVERARGADAPLHACGPPGMLDRLREFCDNAKGVDLILERFTGPAPAEGDTEFTVTLLRSGVELHVPADSSLLDVLEDNGVDIMSSCRSGVCGTCEVDVLSGTPDHRDSVLNETERNEGRIMFPCVSRAVTARLDLDL
jgi:ferredoxin-NADP reductase